MLRCAVVPLLLLSTIPAAVAQEAAASVAAVTPPTPRTPLAASWPADLPASRDAEAATVELLVTIDEEGRVTAVAAVSGAPPFRDLAITTVTATLFDPAREGEAPIAVEVPVRLVFDPPPVNVDGTLAGPDGAPLPDATVHLGERTDVTRADGTFAFRGVPAGEHPLSVDAGALVVEQRLLGVRAGEAIHLVLGAGAPDAATVVGVYRVVREEVVRRSLTAEELRTTPGTMGDPLRAIANLPGAVRTPLDAGWLLVRGGDPRDTGVYVDGVRVPLIYHLGGFTSVVHPGFIDRVDFFPGGQSARYGRATAGVVDLITGERPERLEVRAGANIILAGGFVAAPFPNGGVSAGFRRSYLDVVLGAVPTISDEQAQIAPRFWDWQARVDVGPAHVFGLGYVDTIDASTGDADQLTITINTQRVQGSWTGRLLDKPLLFQPMYGYELRHVVIEAVNTTQDRLVTGPGLRAELQDEGEGEWGWSAGLDWTVEDFEFRYDNVTLDGVFWSPEPYADLRWGRDTRVVLGLRADSLLVAGQRTRGSISPRLSVSSPVSSTVTLVADAGVYHQAPAATGRARARGQRWVRSGSTSTSTPDASRTSPPTRTTAPSDRGTGSRSEPRPSPATPGRSSRAGSRPATPAACGGRTAASPGSRACTTNRCRWSWSTPTIWAGIGPWPVGGVFPAASRFRTRPPTSRPTMCCGRPRYRWSATSTAASRPSTAWTSRSPAGWRGATSTWNSTWTSRTSIGDAWRSR